MKDICEYCYAKDGDRCRIKNQGRSKDCPCTVCLVKSICIDLCEDWVNLLCEVN